MAHDSAMPSADDRVLFNSVFGEPVVGQVSDAGAPEALPADGLLAGDMTDTSVPEMAWGDNDGFNPDTESLLTSLADSTGQTLGDMGQLQAASGDLSFVATTNFWSTPQANAVQATYEIQPVSGCPCPMCGGNSFGTGGVSDGDVGAPAPATTLDTLATYLNERNSGSGGNDFWDEFWGGGSDVSTPFWNLTGAGTNAQNGTITFNMGANWRDGDGLAGASRQEAIRNALDVYEDVLGINFVESSDVNADLVFQDNVFTSGGGERAFANFIRASDGSISQAYVNITPGWSGNGTIGDYFFSTALHEIGHTLGLGHSGNYNAGAGSPTYNNAYWQNDTVQFTMMSYWAQGNYAQILGETPSGASLGSVNFIGPQIVDWLALNRIYDPQGYGINDGATVGNDTWGFNSTWTATNAAPTESTFNDAFSLLSTLLPTTTICIVDGGGIDTLDMSGFSNNGRIDLRTNSGSSTTVFFSNVAGLIGNLSIAVGSVIENAVGGSAGETMHGNDVANTLTGNAGADTVYGGAGNDAVYGGTGNDVMYGGSNTDSLYGGDDNDVIYWDGVDGNTDSLYGGADNDVMYWETGEGNTDYHSGGAGQDTINGGGTSFGTATFDLEAGTYFVPGVGTETWTGFEHYTNFGAGTETVYGSSGANTIYTGSGANVIDGRDGADLIDAGGGADSVLGGWATDTLYGGDGNDTLEGGLGLDTVNGGNDSDLIRILDGEFVDDVYGGNGYDTLDLSAVSAFYPVNINMIAGTYSGFGDAAAVINSIEVIQATQGNDTVQTNSFGITVYGNGGADLLGGESFNQTLYGGAGDDTLLGDGIVAVGSSVGDRLDGGDGNDSIEGAGGADTIYGGADNDFIRGDRSSLLAGLDSMDGGAGTDTVTYDTSAAAVNVTLNSSANTGGAAQGDTLTGFEILIGSAYDDTLNGNSYGDATLQGGAGNDTLTGGFSSQYLYGGEDDDYFYVGAGEYLDSVAGGTGTDTLDHSLVDASDVNGAVFDFETGVGTTGWSSIGTIALSGIEIYYDGTGGNTIRAANAGGSYSGGVGADSMVGRNGDDSMYGGDDNDTLVGGAGADVLFGDFGNDIIRGSTGADNLNGGDGIDSLSYHLSVAAVSVNLATNSVTGGDGTGDTISGFENVSGSAFNDTIRGSTGANSLSGLDGSDSLTGDLGNDTLAGGTGNDTLRGDGGADSLNGGADIDTLTYFGSLAAVSLNLATGLGFGGDASGDTLVGFENVVGTAFNDTIRGSVGAESVNGSGGDDSLTGDLGNDTLAGGTGNDTLRGDGGADSLNGGADIDTLSYFGSLAAVSINLTTGLGAGGDAAGDTLVGFENVVGTAFNDTIRGSAGAESLNGSSGNDTLTGEGGNDTLAGGTGVDRFVFTSGFGNDVIAGFERLVVGEVIDIITIAAITSFADLVANHLTQVGANAVITDGANTITLTNTLTTNLAADDFLF